MRAERIAPSTQPGCTLRDRLEMPQIGLMRAKELGVCSSRWRRWRGIGVVHEARSGRDHDAESIVVLHGQASARDRARDLGIGLEPLLARVIGAGADNLLVEMLTHLWVACAQSGEAISRLE